jgi:PKHD-type hydroxylase
LIIFARSMLTAAELDSIRGDLANAPYVAGATTAGGAARAVKANQQADPKSPAYERAAQRVNTAFLRNAMLRTALLPANVTTVMFNRYGQQMQYGPHVDSPLMGTMGNLLRADIAITVFLSDPDSYQGGELTVKSAEGKETRYKEDAGTAVAYPANSLHHVTPVTSGVRNAAILWVQSLVRDSAKRELLWDLERAQRDLYEQQGRTPIFEAVHRSQTNLIRMWADV